MTWLLCIVDGSRLNYISQRRPVTEDEINRAYITAKSFKSNNPIAAVIMRKAYVYYGFYMVWIQMHALFICSQKHRVCIVEYEYVYLLRETS